MDTVVLACTHFPLVADRLAAVAPRPLRFVDGAAGLARRIAFLTRDQPWPEATQDDITVFTAPMEMPAALRESLAARGLSRIETL